MPVPPTPVVPRPPPGRVYILSKRIDALIEQKNWERAKQPPKSWYASALGKTCGRQLGYARMGVPPEKVIKSQYSRDADAGTHLHEVYQEYMRELGYLAEAEVKIPNPHEIGGRIDGITPDLAAIEGFYEHEDAWEGVVSGDEKIARFVGKAEKGLLEIKTMKAEHFDMMPNHYKWLSYESQAQIYLVLRPDIVRALIFCVCRNDSRTKEFLVERHPARGAYLLARAKYLDDCLKEGTVPEAEPGPLCNYCPFQMRCESDDLREVA